ncbi:sensor histidine kinase [Bradyrhizobium lablabi]|uniref:sensor histidine kinase n=1 Tax=Bradyrhizobium lablabi TaxID=722472 RepID=UPI001BA4C9A8|nr:ATP-binding protein [Bradyrhizobium lablabi]MBR0691901.1 PAS domain S-box protein [Bradyrhizobium lablabi]
MIWNSVPLMTAIDLLIIAVAVYGVWRCRRISPGKRFGRTRISLLLINSGLLALASFYAADLAIMHVLPRFTAMDEAMVAMEALHRNLSWLVTLFAVASISIGFVELLVELQGREARVRRLIDANIVGIFIWGPDDRIVDANDAFLRITGYSRDDLLSKRWTELIPAETRSVDKQRLSKLTASEMIHPYETEYVQRNIGHVPVLVGMTMFEGTPKEGVAFVLDLTDSKKAALALRESEQRHRQIGLELAHANRVSAIGQLSLSIAHEVTQPITATAVSAESALRWLSTEPPNLAKAKEGLGRIVNDVKRAQEIVDRIRSFIKKTPPRRDALAINEAILEVVALIRHEVAKNHVSVETQLTEGLPPVQGDRVQLQQVILNLIMNAVEAMSDSDKRTRQLLINTDKANQKEIRIVVQDSGPGMAPESIDRVFSPFYTTKPSGLGMGLSICRSIIEAHEGRLWATAAEPTGTAFAFTLPVRPDNPL